MSKKVSFSAQPKKGSAVVTPDEWVSVGGKESSSSKTSNANNNDTAKTDQTETVRFTIDIPTDLHARIKSQCALKRVKMREEIQALLEKHFAQNNE